MRPPVRSARLPGCRTWALARLRPGRLRTRGERSRPARVTGRRAGATGRPGAADGLHCRSCARRRAHAGGRRGKPQAAVPGGREPRPPCSGDDRDDLPLAPGVRCGRRTILVRRGQCIRRLRSNGRGRCDRPHARRDRASSPRTPSAAWAPLLRTSPSAPAASDDRATTASNRSKKNGTRAGTAARSCGPPNPRRRRNRPPSRPRAERPRHRPSRFPRRRPTTGSRARPFRTARTRSSPRCPASAAGGPRRQPKRKTAPVV